MKQFGAYDDGDDYSDDSVKNNNKITVMLFIDSNYRPLISHQALLQVTYIYITSFPDMAGAIIISISQKRKLNAQDGEVTGQLVRTGTGVQTQVVPPSPWPNKPLLSPEHSQRWDLGNCGLREIL